MNIPDLLRDFMDSATPNRQIEILLADCDP